ncbi:uncharacterized protein LOC122798540 isoform X2 [Protopterus annectens]|uniref:uncharacterized protein LOC122798540 isoform X2 n=1 Tax=Protopterus annectens TaxID=7888 RepID=UPI001CF931FA|nr:uncharacterized protein LOC122798540 isoform X2 [Protopterus annectens]
MESSSTTISDLFRTLYEMGFDEAQIQAAIQAGCLSVQDATDWLLQGGSPSYRLQPQYSTPSGSLGLAISAFNPPKMQETATNLGLSVQENKQEDLSLISSRNRVDKFDFEKQQRERLAQEAKAEKRSKKADHEMVLKRIADDRKSVQEKSQPTTPQVCSSQQGYKLGGKVQTVVDNKCVLMFRLPSGNSFRERFSAEDSLQAVKQYLAKHCPELKDFILIQSFPKRIFNETDEETTLRTLGLTPNATLCIQSTEPKAAEMMVLSESVSRLPAEDQSKELTVQQEDREGAKEVEELLACLQPQTLPVVGHVWGRGEVLSSLSDNLETERREMEEDIQNSAAQNNDPLDPEKIIPEFPGLPAVLQLSSRHHHHWGRGQKLTVEDREAEEEDTEDEDNGDEEDVLPGLGRPPFCPPNRNQRVFQPQYSWPAEGIRLREDEVVNSGQDGIDSLSNVAAQAAMDRLHRAAQDQQKVSGERSPPKKPSQMPEVPSLYNMATKAAVTLMTAPSMQYCSSLSSLTPELAEHLIMFMIKERLLRPKTLELFFGCQIQMLVLNCYPYATNELLRQVRAFQTLKHLSLISCPLITDLGLSVVVNLQKLQHLNLSACTKLTDSCMQYLTGLKHLTCLSLDQTKVTDSGMGRYLESRPLTLTQLSMNQTGITEKTLFLLPYSVPHLKLLSIKKTKVSDVSALKELKSLHSLHLDQTFLSLTSLLTLADHATLSTLSLSGIPTINGDDALQIISGLKLSHLTLPNKGTVTDNGVAFLSFLVGLSDLDLTDYTLVTDEGIRHICNLHRLKKLSLSNTLLTDGGLPYLENLKELEELCLDRTNITSTGVSHCITKLPRLQVLGLASTHIGDSAVRLGLIYCKSLTKLNLSHTRVTNKGLKYLSKMNLSQVNLDATGVTPVGVADLLSSCPTIVSIRANNLRVLSPEEVSDEDTTL